MFQVACDGSCLENPGPGGWAVIVTDPSGKETIRSGGEPHTTNNRMELMAAIEALASLPPKSRGIVSCDSRYVVSGLRAWLPGWKRQGWKTSGGKPVKNRDLWERLDAAAAAQPGVHFQWVPAHSGHFANEKADGAAFAEAEARRDDPDSDPDDDPDSGPPAGRSAAPGPAAARTRTPAAGRRRPRG